MSVQLRLSASLCVCVCVRDTAKISMIHTQHIILPVKIQQSTLDEIRIKHTYCYYLQLCTVCVHVCLCVCTCLSASVWSECKSVRADTSREGDI